MMRRLGMTKILLLLTLSTVSGFDDYVSLRDVTREPGLPEDITLEVIGDNMKQTTLSLKENKRLYVRGFQQHQESEDIKYYHDKKNRAALSVTCRKAQYGPCKRIVEGFLTIDDKTYEIRPATSELATRLLGRGLLNLHEVTRVVLFDRSLSIRRRFKFPKAQKDYIETKEAKNIQIQETTFKRQSQTEYAVETFIVTDVYLWKLFYDQTEASNGRSRKEATRHRIRRYLSHVINGVSLMYESIEDPGLNVYTTLSGFRIFETENANSPVPKGSHKPKIENGGKCVVDPSSYLDETINWLENERLQHDDHVMFITGCRLSGGTEGIAPLKGACGRDRTSLLGYARYYRLATTAAHELGHNLGANHDGAQNSCKETDRYLMAPSTNQLYHNEPHTANPWRFSPCSIADMKTFLQSEYAQCLANKGNIFDKNEWNKHNEKLPGELYSLDKQCKLMKGPKSGFCPVSSDGISETNEKICQEMRCIDEPECTSHIPARGSPCGKPSDNKWCIYGKCVSKKSSEKDQKQPDMPDLPDITDKTKEKDCYTPGKKYTGKISLSKSGGTCTYWINAQYHYQDYFYDDMFVDKSVEDAQNYCRSPGDDDGVPWCFVDGKYEECDIPIC